MDKNYLAWSSTKEKINNVKERVSFFNEKDVWFASVGLNIGFEQDGKGEEYLRPVIVLKKFNNETFWGVSLTTQKKAGRYYFELGFSNGRTSTVNISQLRLMDSKRLKYKVSTVNEFDFLELKKRITFILK